MSELKDNKMTGLHKTVVLMFVTAIIGMMFTTYWDSKVAINEQNSRPTIETVDSIVTEVVKTEWESFVLAIQFAESSFRKDIVNEVGATGLFQQMPVYVEDANRIVGYNKFILDDRLCPIKSREMFDVIQNHYNPEKDLRLACKYQHPNGGDAYYERVLEVAAYIESDSISVPDWLL